MSTDTLREMFGVMTAPPSRYEGLRTFATHMAGIASVLGDNPAGAMVVGTDFYIRTSTGELTVGPLGDDGYPEWDARTDVNFCNWDAAWEAAVRKGINSYRIVMNPGPEAPFVASPEQYEAYAERIRRLLQANPGHALVAGMEFYVATADGALHVGEVAIDGTLDIDGLLPASADAWAPHYKDELDEALASPRFVKLPERGAPRAPIEQLEALDCCVVVFTAEELRGANPAKVKDRLVELGWDVIDTLA